MCKEKIIIDKNNLNIYSYKDDKWLNVNSAKYYFNLLMSSYNNDK